MRTIKTILGFFCLCLLLNMKGYKHVEDRDLYCPMPYVDLPVDTIKIIHYKNVKPKKVNGVWVDTQ